MSAMQTLSLVDRLGRLDPISSLALKRREEIANMGVGETIRRNRGDMRLTDWENKRVYLVNGEAKLLYDDGSFEVLVAGSGLARQPLGKEGSPIRTLKPITDIELWSMDEEMLDLVLVWAQSTDIDSASDKKSDAKPDWSMKPSMFAAHHLAGSAFATLPPANIENLLNRFERVEVKRSEIVLRENDIGDYYYVIESGRCSVTRRVGGGEMEIATLKPGDAFGEEALLSDTSRNATVTMKTNGVLLRLNRTDFFELLREPLLNRIDWREAQSQVVSGAQWVDVRFAAEFTIDGLPNAINIPLNEIRRSVSLLKPDQNYIVYCQSGRRSSAAAFLLSQSGLRACVLDGGLRARAKTLPEANTP